MFVVLVVFLLFVFVCVLPFLSELGGGGAFCEGWLEALVEDTFMCVLTARFFFLQTVPLFVTLPPPLPSPPSPCLPIVLSPRCYAH